jgi:DNA-directed RNA polymerase subunit omega
MINPSIVDLLEIVDSRYSLVSITAKRARQLIDGDKPLVDSSLTKALSIAINELNTKALTFEKTSEGIK